MSSKGQKVTTDPESTQKPVYEGGLVTSDSLAAESVNSETGTFGANNPHTGVSKQPSDSTTSNVTDTSAAERLAPAHDAASRSGGKGTHETFDEGRIDPYTHKTIGDEIKTDESKPDESKPDEIKTDEIKTDEIKTDEIKTDDIKTDDIKTDDSNTDESKSVKNKTGQNKSKEVDTDEKFEMSGGSGNTDSGQSKHQRETPSKATGSSADDDDSGFDDSVPNASFNNEIGGPNDPGRVAIQQIVEHNAINAANSGRQEDKKLDVGGQYDSLKEEPAPEALRDSDKRDETDSTSKSKNDSQSNSEQKADTGIDDSVLNATKNTRTTDEEESDEKPEAQVTKSHSNSGQDQKSETDSSILDQNGNYNTSGSDKPEDTRPKDEIIDERQKKLDLPDQPPVASDWQSLDARNVNV